MPRALPPELCCLGHWALRSRNPQSGDGQRALTNTCTTDNLTWPGVLTSQTLNLDRVRPEDAAGEWFGRVAPRLWKEPPQNLRDHPKPQHQWGLLRVQHLQLHAQNRHG